MLPSNMLDLSEPKTASVEGWSVSSWGNPSFKRRAGTDGFLPNLAVYHRERSRPSDPMRKMNEWQKLASGAHGLNDRKWVKER